MMMVPVGGVMEGAISGVVDSNIGDPFTVDESVSSGIHKQVRTLLEPGRAPR